MPTWPRHIAAGALIAGVVSATWGCADTTYPEVVVVGTTGGPSTSETGASSGAPDESRSSGTPQGDPESSSTGELDLDPLIDCGMPALAAVGASYQHRPQLTGISGAVMWTIEGLPKGMILNPLTGEITGVPLQRGDFDFDVTASGSNGVEVSQTCSLTVAQALSVDLSGLQRPCMGPKDDLAVLVSGGDGSAYSCSIAPGNGNGRAPTGVDVDPRSCAMTGTADDTYGIWAWTTVLEQSGYRIYVPYCYANDQLPDGDYPIEVDHGIGSDNRLSPSFGRFAVGETVSWGGNRNPIVRVLGCPDGSCFFGYAYRVGPSPFGECQFDDCFGLDPVEPIANPDGGSLGYSHELWALGGEVSSAFTSRPFVLTWDIDYCFADDAATCSGVDNVRANGNGSFHFSVIMEPDSPR